MRTHLTTRLTFMMLVLSAVCAAGKDEPSSWIDPMIGSEGLGRVFIGPASPFGMVRPGPDCTPSPNSGWLPMPERVGGFAQTHVSGTGGGPKYGNILIQPFVGDMSLTSRPAYRKWEKAECGYYATEYEDSGIITEITTTPRASAYRFIYPETISVDGNPGILVDAGFFLGESPVPDAREAQQFVGSEIEVIGDHEVAGYSRIRGGWNNGKAYTVYFHALFDKGFKDAATWQGETITTEKNQSDAGIKTGTILLFPSQTDTVNARIGISFISERKARQNALDCTEGKSFEEIRAGLQKEWDEAVGKFKLSPQAPDSIKRMFYTGLYHTLLMPSDRTGENPLWTDFSEDDGNRTPVPYYDDFYAIWDTYRTSMPMITLLDRKRMADIVNSLVNIAKRDGYMPDARSGNCNGRTQGGSNAEIVVADAFLKGVEGVDYEAALEAMLKDATVDPGHDHEAHGRGGLTEYLRLGYVPHGTARAGNRTVEYSFCDHAISKVAEGLGKKDLADRYSEMSHNWRNLWRGDYEHDGARGFIMPRDAKGEWLDSIQFGHSSLLHPKFEYTPITFEGPWYAPWWDMFFYEASSWEYSLSMPHDVDMLIEVCGGPDVFLRRLDTFFEHGHYNVNNEPSFLTPCLYHWLGRPDRSADRIRYILTANFYDSAKGLPGNDDSGAMSSWLAFHILGLYPNAGHDWYLINPPMTDGWRIDLDNGNQFKVSVTKKSDKSRYITSAELNGTTYPYSTISHKDIMTGGALHLTLSDTPTDWGLRMSPQDTRDRWISDRTVYVMNEKSAQSAYDDTQSLGYGKEVLATDTVHATYFLHGQKRRFQMTFNTLSDGSVLLDWKIERNLKWWHGSYLMLPEGVAEGTGLSLLMPEDGNNVILPANKTYGMLSKSQYLQLKNEGKTSIDGIEYIKTGESEGTMAAHEPLEGAQITVLDRPDLPMILRMRSNPLGIDWEYRLDCSR